MPRLPVIAPLAGLLALVACGGGSAQVDDSKTPSALPMEVNGLLDDRIDADGDPVDWKYFQLETDQDVFLFFFFDDPDVKADLALFTGAVNRVASVPHQASAEYDLLQAPNLRAGKYYLRVKAASGASVYTIRSAGGDKPNLFQSGGNTEPRPE
jgi:hypothetical protein